MCHVRGAEQNVSSRNIGHPVIDTITAGSRGNEIEFIAQVRYLRAVRWPGGEPYLQITINKYLGRSPGRSRHRERGSKRDWGWRVIHCDFPPLMCCLPAGSLDSGF